MEGSGTVSTRRSLTPFQQSARIVFLLSARKLKSVGRAAPGWIGRQCGNFAGLNQALETPQRLTRNRSRELSKAAHHARTHLAQRRLKLQMQRDLRADPIRARTEGHASSVWKLRARQGLPQNSAASLLARLPGLPFDRLPKRPARG